MTEIRGAHSSRTQAPPRWLWHSRRLVGVRCVPTPEYLAARAAGDLDTQHEFYSRLLMRNGVYRTTHVHRMNDLTPILSALALESTVRPLRVLDVACSSGISTLELHQGLVAAGVDCETWGTDPALSARLVRRDDGWGVLFDRDRQPIQIERGRWATPWKERPRDRWLHPARVARVRRLLDRELDGFRQALVGPVSGYTLTEVPLLASACDGVPGIRFAEESLLAPQVEGLFHLIRAANIMNLGYFDEATLRFMGQALSARLAPGGLLTLVRTSGEPPKNRGSIFRWDGARFKAEVTFNGGSEITPLITP